MPDHAVAAATRPTVLYIVTEDWYFWMHRLALGRGALAAGYDVVVAARVQQHREVLEAEGFRVVALPWRRRGSSPGAELATLLQLWKLCRRLRPAVVHAIALKPIIYGSLVARLAGVPLRVSTVAGLGYVFSARRWKARVLRPLVAVTLAFALGGSRSLVTLENRDDGDVLGRYGALRSDRIALVCSCGVDCNRFTPGPEVQGPPTIGMACRLVRDKGVALAVEAVRQLRATGTDIRFLLAGSVDPGNPDSHTEAEIRGWVSEGLVEWLGQISDMPGFWRRCQIAVYPSRYGEGLPRTLLEAASCALPVVTTDMPGCRDAIEAGVTGFLVGVDDTRAIAARVGELARDASLRRRMGHAGRARVLAEFDDPIVVSRMLSVYRLR